MKKPMSLLAKMMLSSILGILAFSFVLLWVYLKIEERVYEDKRASLKSITDVVYTLIVEYDARVKSGEFSLEEGQRRAATRAKNMRYKEKEYFWINDLTPKMVMHPYKPEMDGKDISGHADPNGKHLFVEMAKVCKADGEGYVDYMWPKPGVDQTKPMPKISFVKLYKPWGWIIGTGIYVDDVEKELGQLRLIFGGIAFFLLALGMASNYWFARSTSRPIIHGVRELDFIAERVDQASGQVTAAGNRLADGASEQAAAIEETSSSLEQIAAMTRKNADNASEVDHLMKETRTTVGRASQSMAALSTSMTEISSASEDIQKIIKSIDEIAFQTNLLALNAAVEAARAGEAGAGFAVVADEVRNLAMRAADAAKNTATLIESTVKRICTGSDLVRKTTNEFSDVTNNINSIGGLVEEIAAASGEQAEGISHLNKAVAQMDKVVQQNSASAHETANSAEQMSAQAGNMRHHLDQLLHSIGAKRDSAGSEKSPARRGTRSDTVAPRKGLPTGRRTSAAAMPVPKKTGGETAAHRHQSAKLVSPEQVIPFDDQDMSDF